MACAYLKVWVRIGGETAVRDALRKIEGVRRADLTTGEQDVIAIVEAADFQAILDKVMTSVRSIEGVERTVTNLVLE